MKRALLLSYLPIVTLSLKLNISKCQLENQKESKKSRKVLGIGVAGIDYIVSAQYTIL